MASRFDAALAALRADTLHGGSAARLPSNGRTVLWLCYRTASDRWYAAYDGSSGALVFALFGGSDVVGGASTRICGDAPTRIPTTELQPVDSFK